MRPSPDPAVANSLFTFMALRFSGTYMLLNELKGHKRVSCADLLGQPNPVTLTLDAAGHRDRRHVPKRRPDARPSAAVLKFQACLMLSRASLRCYAPLTAAGFPQKKFLSRQEECLWFTALPPWGKYPLSPLNRILDSFEKPKPLEERLEKLLRVILSDSDLCLRERQDGEEAELSVPLYVLLPDATMAVERILGEILGERADRQPVFPFMAAA